MAEGKRMTLGELFKQREAEAKAEYQARLAYEATPEGKAELAEREAYHRRMREADERYAEEHPPDPFETGRSAAIAGDPRDPPDDLPEGDAERWLEGWDSEAPGEDE